MQKNKYIIFLFFGLLTLAFNGFSQSVGVVLSGGGASGMAHIGVLKALEENNIPIDYITGTSIGALVGGLYAAGYSPAEIEKIMLSESFRNQAYGTIDEKYVYYFKKKDDNASWINFKVSLDSAFITTIPTNLISPLPIDFGLMNLFAQSSASASYKFDSLMIPFRCIASDIESKETVVFRDGDLGQAIRASISYPFYLKPITVNGRLLFDGGLYNNFPSDVLCNDFKPDFIIGSNVTSNAPSPNEENLYSQIRTMFVSKTKFELNCATGIIIEPKTETGLFNFDNIQPLVDSGYVAAKRQIDFIKDNVARRSAPPDLAKKRDAFRAGAPKPVFDNIIIEGLDRKQSQYVKQLLRKKEKQISMEEMTPQYFRLAADDKIKDIFPLAKYKPETGFYELHLKVKKEKDLITYFGGNFSNRPINTGFAGIQYNYLGTVAVTVFGNLYFGKLYTSSQVKARIDFPSRIPFYIEPNITFNRWDFFKSSTAFFEDVKPAYLIQNEEYGEINAGFPVSYKGKFVLGGSIVNINNRYYQTDRFLQSDTSDRTSFRPLTAQAYYEKNSLNRKQYASSGTYFTAKAMYIQGNEFHEPGSASFDTLPSNKFHEWVQFKLVFDHYLRFSHVFKTGIYAEGVYSTQTLFNNYTASILSAPAFYPVPESKTLFLEDMRSHKYIAGGIKTIFNLFKGMDLRLEAYAFLPYQAINKSEDLTASYGIPFATKRYIGTAAAVYQTPLGPLSISVNYYDKKAEPFTFLLHFGYIIFNKRALD